MSLSLILFYRMKKFYIEAAAASNITIPDHPVTFDPEASWLQFHLGINRYALYSRDDSSVDRLLRDMQTATVISAGDVFSNRATACESEYANVVLPEKLMCSISLCLTDFTQDEKALKGACDCSQGKCIFFNTIIKFLAEI